VRALSPMPLAGREGVLISLTALLLVLAAAVVHATWNLLLSGAADTRAAAAVTVVIGVIAFAPAAALTWHLSARALPYIAASSVLELAYLALLARGYERAEMSFVYPIARGSAPVFVLLGSVVALGASISALTTLGVLLIAGGIVFVRGWPTAAIRATSRSRWPSVSASPATRWSTSTASFTERRSPISSWCSSLPLRVI
jgi:uncharacterized membrane protein